MARGGRRQGTPGTPYSNRSDLRQPIRTITGQQYGERAALENAQRAIPLPNTTSVPTPAAPEQAPAAPPMVPGALDFARASERPNEPVTAGLPTGPGPGPEILGLGGQPAADDIGQTLRAIYQANPSNDLLRLIELHDQGY